METTFNEPVSAAGPTALLMAIPVTSPGTHSGDGRSRPPPRAKLPVCPVRPSWPVPRRAPRRRRVAGSEVGAEPLQLPRIRVAQEQQLPPARLCARCRGEVRTATCWGPGPGPQQAVQPARHSTPGTARQRQPGTSPLTRCAPYAPAPFGLNSAPARPRSICLPHPRSLFWALGPSDLPADTVLPNPSPSPQVPGGPCHLQLPREGKAFTHPHPPPPTAGVPSTPADKGRARRGWVWCWAVPARVSLGVAEW